MTLAQFSARESLPGQNRTPLNRKRRHKSRTRVRTTEETAGKSIICQFPALRTDPAERARQRGVSPRVCAGPKATKPRPYTPWTQSVALKQSKLDRSELQLMVLNRVHFIRERPPRFGPLYRGSVLGFAVEVGDISGVDHVQAGHVNPAYFSAYLAVSPRSFRAHTSSRISPQGCGSDFLPSSANFWNT
jgi:hypothetical protein